VKRRNFILGAAGLGAAAYAWREHPADEGAPYTDYFRTLNEELKRNGPMHPVMVIDLDRLDQNIGVVTSSIKAPKHYRIVEKSLPSGPLLDYVRKKAGTNRLMSFNQPFINDDAEAFPDADILLGKPMPVHAAEAFYKNLKGSFDPSRQLQWLISTPERLKQYAELAAGLSTKMRINIELDVGLHRGGVADNDTLGQLLALIAADPQHLEFSGFMGYDPQVVKVPPMLGSRPELFAGVMKTYQARVDFVRGQYAQLWHEDLCLNTAGSPTYKLHQAESLSNDISVGSALVKPTDFDVDTLVEHQPACFIATPVLKASEDVVIPGLEGKSKVLSWWDVNERRTYFIYGGNWMAKYESPAGLRRNDLFGHSSNQEMANASPAVGLKVDDNVFLRPTQSEAVFLQFGDLVAVRGGKIQEYWAPLKA
jgi:D-serine deaminase-like pyridoxal phosphate-dependent protein